MTTDNNGPMQLINGTSRADELCQKDAERAGLWGRYSALLSTKQHPLRNITEERYRHLPVVNTAVSGPASFEFLMLIFNFELCITLAWYILSHSYTRLHSICVIISSQCD